MPRDQESPPQAPPDEPQVVATRPTPEKPPEVAKPPPEKPTSAWPDYQVPTLPADLVLHRNTLVWADLAGALWILPTDGEKAPRRISDQHSQGFAAHPIVAGDRVLAKRGKGLLAVDVATGAVTKIELGGVAQPLENVVGDNAAIYFTLFNQAQVMRAPANGGPAERVIEAKGAAIALHGDALYVVSYATGELRAVPTAGGAPRSISKKLKSATAIAVDDEAAYVYTEADKKLKRVELATGAITVLGDRLENSDEVRLARDAVYTVSWPNKLVRMAKSAGPATAISDKLFQPRGVVYDDRFVYVSSDQPARIVRVAR